MANSGDIIMSNGPPTAEPEYLEGDEDELVAEYDILITPELDEQLYLLQYPNRKLKPTPDRMPFRPHELRTKSLTGFIELDMEITPDVKFDAHKGAKWGQALKDAKAGGGSFGLASGFGKANKLGDLPVIPADGVSRPGSPGGSDDEIKDVDDAASEMSEEMTGKEEMLKFQTLGGQIIPPKDGKPMFMLGVFHGDQLHLSHVSGTSQMRPQFHHIDARNQLAKERATRKTVGTTAAAARLNEPRLVQQSARNAADVEEINIKNTENFLTRASEEKWVKQRYHDAESDESYHVYNESMFSLIEIEDENVDLKCPMDKDTYIMGVNPPAVESED
jgi:DNA-directed RNA polymerase-3 subunit RPC5